MLGQVVGILGFLVPLLERWEQFMTRRQDPESRLVLVLALARWIQVNSEPGVFLIEGERFAV